MAVRLAMRARATPGDNDTRSCAGARVQADKALQTNDSLPNVESDSDPAARRSRPESLAQEKPDEAGVVDAERFEDGDVDRGAQGSGEQQL